jgi:hypothetical protein
MTAIALRGVRVAELPADSSQTKGADRALKLDAARLCLIGNKELRVHRQVLIDVAAGFLIPLVPAVLLYELFDSLNSASVIQTNQGIKLGGPAALYFILLTFALRYINRWRTKTDPFAKLRKDLIGTWDVDSVSSHGRKAVSKSSFQLDDDSLSLAGGSFDEEGKTIGNWTPDHIILDRDRDQVIFLYDLKDATGGVNWRGLMELTIDRGTQLVMKGTWEVIGPNHHSGTVTFVKRDK